MGTDNYAYGVSAHNDLPFIGLGAGVKTHFGMQLPSTSRVAAYVRSAAVSNDPPEIAARRVATLAAGLKQCRSGQGDIVVVLPGHSESVVDATMLTNLVAGTRIVGWGSPRQADAPTFRWTATAAQWAVTVANVQISGLKLQMEGANGVVKALNVTAAGFSLVGCEIQVASGAALKSTIAIEIGSAATKALISGNYIYGTETHNVTDCIKVVGATVPSDLMVTNNKILASATAANGLVHITVAALRCQIAGNVIYNTHTSSTACIAVDAVAADGVIYDNYLATLNNGVATAQGITLGAGALFRAFQNFSSDEPQKSGVLTPTVVAT